MNLGASTTFDLNFGDGNGVYTVIVRATDDDSGSTSSNQFNIVVNAVNDAPVSPSRLPSRLIPAGKVIFSSANGNLISVSDVDAGTGLLKVTLTATHGYLTLNGVTGLTFDPGQGDGTADATMTFTGTLADINNALNGMTFDAPNGMSRGHDYRDFYGLADVTITVDDQGNTGAGGALTAAGVANVSVEPYGVWFAGFGSDAGWLTYNYDGGSYYTHDYTVFWQHVTSQNGWNFYNGSAWVSTNTLGEAPYDGGYGPWQAWFHEDAGPYQNWDVYITAGMTYYSEDWDASGSDLLEPHGSGSVVVL